MLRVFSNRSVSFGCIGHEAQGCSLPSAFRRSDRPFLRFAASERSASPSSASLVSFSRWVRAALCFLAPFVAAFARDSSSDAGWDMELLCFEAGAGEGENVRCLFAVSLLLKTKSAVDSQANTRISRNTHAALSLRLRLPLRLAASSALDFVSPLLSSIARLSCSSSS